MNTIRKTARIGLFLLLTILSLGVVSCTVNANKEQKSTKVQLSAMELDMGNVKLNTLVKKELELTNIGDEPLTIYNIKTSCGCTEVEWEHKPIRPHKSTRVCVSYKDKYPGYIHKTITIYGNLAEPIIVSLKGELIE